MANTTDSAVKRSVRIMLITIVIYAVLVATHLGEFWPFSIFPMFSKAGQPWTRAMAKDITDYEGNDIWTLTLVEELPGETFSMRAHRVDQIDYSNFVSKTRNWLPARVQGLRNMLGEHHLENRRVMIYKVSGRLSDGDSVKVEAIPFLLLEADTSLFNPHLPHSNYFRD
jgi:hypothetical protein